MMLHILHSVLLCFLAVCIVSVYGLLVYSHADAFYFLLFTLLVFGVFVWLRRWSGTSRDEPRLIVHYPVLPNPVATTSCVFIQQPDNHVSLGVPITFKNPIRENSPFV